MSLITNFGQNIVVSNIVAQISPSTTIFIDSPLQLKDNVLFNDPQPNIGDVLTFSSGVWKPAVPSGGGGGISSLNGLISSSQSFTVGNSGTDFNITSSMSTHTFNLPSANITSRGVINTTSQILNGDKTFLGNVIIGTSNKRNLWNGGIEIGSTMTSTASETYAIAIGKRTTSQNRGGIAMGLYTYAQSTDSVAIGRSTTSSNKGGVCIGRGNFGTNMYSTAVGTNAQPHFDYSSCFGTYSVTRDTNAVSIGHAAYVGFNAKYGISIGYFSQCAGNNDNGIAIGVRNTCAGDNIVIGRRALTSLPKGIAIGHGDSVMDRSYVNGNNSLSLGFKTFTLGLNLTTIGYNLINRSQDAIVIGQNSAVEFITTPITIGNGATDIAVGTSSSTNLTIGHNAKHYTRDGIAQYYSVVIGSSAYNRSSHSSVAIGNQASVGSSIGIYNVPDALLNFRNIAIGSNARVFSTASPPSRGSIAIGKNASASNRTMAIALGYNVTAISNNGFFVSHNTTMAAGTPARFSGNELVELVSSNRFKDNIVNLEDVSEKFLKLRPVRFNMKKEYGGDENKKQLGLIAEELSFVFPEFVTFEEDKVTPKGIDYDLMVALLVKQLQTINNETQHMTESINQMKKTEIEHDLILNEIKNKLVLFN